MKIYGILTAILACSLFLGCTKSTPTDTATEHDHSLATLADGVEQVKGFRDAVKAAFESGNPTECDGALHEASHVLKELANAGDVAAMSAEDQATVKEATDILFEQFFQIHESFHGGDVDMDAYKNVAGKMDAALETLSSKAATHPAE